MNRRDLMRGFIFLIILFLFNWLVCSPSTVEGAKCDYIINNDQGAIIAGLGNDGKSYEINLEVWKSKEALGLPFKVYFWGWDDELSEFQWIERKDATVVPHRDIYLFLDFDGFSTWPNSDEAPYLIRSILSEIARRLNLSRGDRIQMVSGKSMPKEENFQESENGLIAQLTDYEPLIYDKTLRSWDQIPPRKAFVDEVGILLHWNTISPIPPLKNLHKKMIYLEIGSEEDKSVNDDDYLYFRYLGESVQSLAVQDKIRRTIATLEERINMASSSYVISFAMPQLLIKSDFSVSPDRKSMKSNRKFVKVTLEGCQSQEVPLTILLPTSGKPAETFSLIRIGQTIAVGLLVLAIMFFLATGGYVLIPLTNVREFFKKIVIKWVLDLVKER
jgi:hypothetical protein